MSQNWFNIECQLICVFPNRLWWSYRSTELTGLMHVTIAWCLLECQQVSTVVLWIPPNASTYTQQQFGVSNILAKAQEQSILRKLFDCPRPNMRRFNLASSGYGSYFFRMFASVWICSFPVASDRLFQVTLDTAGQNMCATDPPSLTLSLPPTSGPVCVPGNARCGWKCSMTPQCTNYNFKSADQCELFFFEPQGFSLVDGCTHFNYETSSNMVSQLMGCRLNYYLKMPI